MLIYGRQSHITQPQCIITRSWSSNNVVYLSTFRLVHLTIEQVKLKLRVN